MQESTLWRYAQNSYICKCIRSCGSVCHFDNYRGLHHSKNEDRWTRRHISWRNPRSHYFQQTHDGLYWLQYRPKLLHVQFKCNIRGKRDLKRQLEAGHKWVNSFLIFIPSNEIINSYVVLIEMYRPLYHAWYTCYSIPKAVVGIILSLFYVFLMTKHARYKQGLFELYFIVESKEKAFTFTNPPLTIHS